MLKQLIIATDEATILKLHDLIIAVKTPSGVVLDKKYWNYSESTAKYLIQFLGEPRQRTIQKINDRIYKLINLN